MGLNGKPEGPKPDGGNARDKALVLDLKPTRSTPAIPIEQGRLAAIPATRLGVRLDAGTVAMDAGITEGATVASATAGPALRHGMD